jgi:hypothetical protein
MKPRPVLRVAGPAWELARSFLLLAFLAAGSSSSGNVDMLSAPWLAAVGAAGLVMPAAFLVFALAPDRYAAFLPLLRLGKGLEIATVALLFATGTIAPGSGTPLLAFRVPVLGSVPMVFAFVGVADVAVLIGLFRVRTDRGSTGAP